MHTEPSALRTADAPVLHRSFSLGAALSLTIGLMIPQEEDEAMLLASHLLGYPPMAQALPYVADALRARVLAQHPGLPTEFRSVPRQAWDAFLADQEARFGKTLLFKPGDPS